ncbi:lysozyme inhibitor LprI family protein [Ideonella sp.]|uniref:lysozyme inhibitor LprI family protein n=1 Tax=Ideonella sp. TaxID=1929293 RepID=UPI0035B3CC00
MSTLLRALILATATVNAPAWSTEATPSCEDKATTQGDLNACAGGDMRRADERLNAVYQAVLKKHQADTSFVRKLQAAQRAWLAWRDAEMEALYPGRADPAAYGSVLPMCWSTKIATLTKARAAQLQQWLDGVPEGEVCAGSLSVDPK